MSRKLNEMMDCVKKAFDEGCQRGDEFQKMRHAIVVELKRLGFDTSEIKDKLLEWNERCEKPLGLSEQKIQLFQYVDWVFKKNCKVGCRALDDYCLGKEQCQFYINKYLKNRKQTKELPFNYSEVKKFLEERFKGPNGYMLKIVLDTLIWYQHENATGPVIYIGCRKICSLIRDRYNHRPSTMDVHRKLYILIEEEIIKKAEQGKRGNFSKQANGYMFLPWKHP